MSEGSVILLIFGPLFVLALLYAAAVGMCYADSGSPWLRPFFRLFAKLNGIEPVQVRVVSRMENDLVVYGIRTLWFATREDAEAAIRAKKLDPNHFPETLKALETLKTRKDY